MKKTLFWLATAAILVSCNKVDNPQPNVEEFPSQEVTISLCDNMTKALSDVHDKTINKTKGAIKILAFDASGRLSGYGENNANATDITMSIKQGQTDIFAIVNSTEVLADVKTKAQLLAKKSLLRNNNTTYLVMTGHVTENISSTSQTINIPVDRFASKIKIDKITMNFSSPAHQQLSCHLNGIYLTNVAGDCNFDCTSVPTIWFNKLKDETATAQEGSDLRYLKPLISDTFKNKPTPDAGSVLKHGESHATPHYFYCYPNNTQKDSHDDVWSARYTRLVVEIDIDNTIYYYPINLPNLERNKLYEITNLTITGLGSDSPELPLEKGNYTVSISINDWATAFSKEVKY